MRVPALLVALVVDPAVEQPRDDDAEGGGTARRSRRGGAGKAAKGKGGKGKGARASRRGRVEEEEVEEGGSKVLAIIGLILGILALPACWIPLINIGLFLVVIGLIFCLYRSQKRWCHCHHRPDHPSSLSGVDYL